MGGDIKWQTSRQRKKQKNRQQRRNKTEIPAIIFRLRLKCRGPNILKS